MTTKQKFDLTLLNSFCLENKVSLNENYNGKKLTKDTLIHGKCKNCQNSFKKNFRTLINQGGPFCKACVYVNRTNKTKQTNLKKYGVENPMFLESIRHKVSQTNIQKYGVKYPLTLEITKEKIIKTNLDRYGVKHNFNNSDTQEKRKQTFIKNYGVTHPMQNEFIFQKNMKNSYRRKKFIFPSGKEVFVQGYEPFCLRDLLEQKQNEEDIITGLQEVPEVWYMDKENKKHRYYTDIYIKSENKCIEVKSTYTFKLDTEKILLKQQAVKDLGIECEIWVYSSKGELVEKI